MSINYSDLLGRAEINGVETAGEALDAGKLISFVRPAVDALLKPGSLRFGGQRVWPQAGLAAGRSSSGQAKQLALTPYLRPLPAPGPGYWRAVSNWHCPFRVQIPIVELCATLASPLCPPELFTTSLL